MSNYFLGKCQLALHWVVNYPCVQGQTFLLHGSPCNLVNLSKTLIFWHFRDFGGFWVPGVEECQTIFWETVNLPNKGL